MCCELDSSLKSLEADCKNLNQYYIEPRYPLGAPNVYPKKEAKEAIEAAEKVVTLITNAT